MGNSFVPDHEANVKILPKPVRGRPRAVADTTRVRVWPAVWAMVPFIPGAVYVVAYLGGREVGIMGPFAGMTAAYGLWHLISKVGSWLQATHTQTVHHPKDKE